MDEPEVAETVLVGEPGARHRTAAGGVPPVPPGRYGPATRRRPLVPGRRRAPGHRHLPHGTRGRG